jgi:hypothetical protein
LNVPRLPNRAQAESIGTVLLVAIVVVSATTFGAYYVASRTGGSAGGAAGSAGGAGGTSVDLIMKPTNESLTLSHNGGRSISTESLRVSVANASGDFSYTFSDGEIRGGANEQFDPGETWEINWTQSAGSEVTVSVIDDATGTLLLQETTTIGSATESDTGGSAGGTEPAEPTFSVDAGPSRTSSGEAGSTVGLDGSANGEGLTYQWEIVEYDGLSSSTVSIADDQSLDATFEVHENITDQDHTVVVELTAENGTVSASDQTTVRIEKFNRPPVADAGEDTELTDQSVELNGTGSSDPDGDELEYNWTITDRGGLPEDEIKLVDARSETPEVNASSNLSDGQTIEIELTVTDTAGATATDRVTVYPDAAPTIESVTLNPESVTLGSESVLVDVSVNATHPTDELTYEYSVDDIGVVFIIFPVVLVETTVEQSAGATAQLSLSPRGPYTRFIRDGRTFGVTVTVRVLDEDKDEDEREVTLPVTKA